MSTSRTSTVLVAMSLFTGGLTFAQQPAIWTAQYNNARTGANLGETVLTTSNVNAAHFHLLFKRPVDGIVYAQPLYVPNLPIRGGIHNVVYVATMNNSVYAFDADNPANSAPLWHVNLGPAVPIGRGQIYLGTQIGILSTPVIDTTTNTIYVVAFTDESDVAFYRLHALDIVSGQEKFNGPVVIGGSVPGTAPDAVNGIVTFNARNLLQRPALSLVGSSVLVAFGPLTDTLIYHGWLMTYNTSLQPANVFCTTPNGVRGGIWMSGRGIAADVNGIYFMVGDGTTGNRNVSDSFVRMLGHASDFFLPDNYGTLNENDWDLNAGGPLLISGTPLVVGGGKTGALFVLNRTNLGHVLPGNSQIVQTWQATAGCGTHSCSEIHHYAYWQKAPSQPLLYLWAASESLKAFAFNGTTFDTTPAAENPTVANYPGGQLAISANGGKAGTGILWAAMSTANAASGPVPGMLRAFDAVSLTELWNSTMNPGDDAGVLAKFCLPTVVNGKVYLATFSNQLNVYGRY